MFEKFGLWLRPLHPNTKKRSDTYGAGSIALRILALPSPKASISIANPTDLSGSYIKEIIAKFNLGKDDCSWFGTPSHRNVGSHFRHV